VSTMVRRPANSAGPIVGVSASLVPVEDADGPAESASPNVGHRGSFILLGWDCGITRLSFCDGFDSAFFPIVAAFRRSTLRRLLAGGAWAPGSKADVLVTAGVISDDGLGWVCICGDTDTAGDNEDNEPPVLGRGSIDKRRFAGMVG